MSVKMGPIIESGHDIKQFSGFRGANTLMTFGYDGTVILRSPEAPVKYGEPSSFFIRSKTLLTSMFRSVDA